MSEEKQPLTWEQLRKLKDRTPINVQSQHMDKPYACVLRWEIPQTACICAFDPATMDDTHVLARYTRERFERKQPRIWVRYPSQDEIVCARPQATERTHGKWWDDA